jgi:hypothetical protein
MTTTMTDVLGLAALDFALDPPPTVGVPEAQGDLIFLPWPTDVQPERRARDIAEARPLERPEVLVEGRGGNAHVLVDPDGAGVRWDSYGSAQTLGVLVVPDGARACVDHRQHGRNALGPGVWVVRRQRVQADEVRLARD